MTKIIHSWEQETSLTLLYELPRTQSSTSYVAMTKFLRIPYCPPPPPTKTFWSLPAWRGPPCRIIPAFRARRPLSIGLGCVSVHQNTASKFHLLVLFATGPRLAKAGEERSVADHHQKTNQGIDLRWILSGSLIKRREKPRHSEASERGRGVEWEK